jgi:hypothetical protein
MCVRHQDEVAVFDAICPHRGANLAYGGALDGEVVICPFHGYRIGLGDQARGDFCVRQYPTLVMDELVFVRLSDRPMPDLPAFAREFAAQHSFVTGFEIEANTTLAIVVENGFDGLHFRCVHGLSNEPEFTVTRGPLGELVSSGTFEFPSWNYRTGKLDTGRATYRGSAFSPGVGFGTLSGDEPFNYTVITTAVPGRGQRGCKIRMTLAFPIEHHGEVPNASLISQLLPAIRDGLEKDAAIWNHMCLESPIHWTPRDAPAIEVGKFCKEFC